MYVIAVNVYIMYNCINRSINQASDEQQHSPQTIISEAIQSEGIYPRALQLIIY